MNVSTDSFSLSHPPKCPESDANAERPLVSFILIAYNQEKFIREAVEGAFSQTYSPLEIILSDDYSSDHTFAIMKEMAEAYQGPHSLLVHRNESNLGLGGHINKCWKIAKGEFFCMAAGDDISLPQRVELLMSCIRPFPSVYCISSNYIVINDMRIATSRVKTNNIGSSRNDVEDLLSDRPFPFPAGATILCRRDVFDVFGPILVDCEDNIIRFRALLLGQVMYAPDRLVYYYVSSSRNYFSSENYRLSQLTSCITYRTTLDLYLADALKARNFNLISPIVYQRIYEYILSLIMHHNDKFEFFTTPHRLYFAFSRILFKKISRRGKFRIFYMCLLCNPLTFRLTYFLYRKLKGL